MKVLVALSAIVGIAAIYFSVFRQAVSPSNVNYDFSNWKPAGPGDVRSPCPVLNALANHEILPHSGKGLSVGMMMEVLPGALNLGPFFSAVLAIGGLFTSDHLMSGTFDLNNLNIHNFIEHDASLGHADHSTGDNHSFNKKIFDSYIASYGGAKKTSFDSAAKARWMRVLTESDRDLHFTYGLQQLLISYGETVLVLAALGGEGTGSVPIEWMKVLWEEERFPYNEGWRTTASNIDFISVNKAVAKLQMSGDIKQELSLVANNTYTRTVQSVKSLFA